MSTVKISRDLMDQLVGEQRHTKESQAKVAHLKDLLDKMTTLDPAKRISIVDSLRHPFIMEKWDRSLGAKTMRDYFLLSKSAFDRDLKTLILKRFLAKAGDVYCGAENGSPSISDYRTRSYQTQLSTACT